MKVSFGSNSPFSMVYTEFLLQSGSVLACMVLTDYL